jgi:hypothetical protein
MERKIRAVLAGIDPHRSSFTYGWFLLCFQTKRIQPDSRVGFSLTSPYYYFGTIFAGAPDYVQCAEQGETLLSICLHLKVCVLQGSPTIPIVTNHFDDEAAIIRMPDLGSVYMGFISGECNTIATVTPPWQEQKFRDAGYTGNYSYGTKLFSKHPLAMVTRGKDVEFADFCNWIVQALIADEYHSRPCGHLSHHPRLWG